MTTKEDNNNSDDKYRYPLRDIALTDKDGNREIIGTEVRHLLSDKSWNDNWEPTGIYMAEVRDQKDKFIAFIDFNENEEGEIRECPHCLEFEVHNKLKPRILKKGEQRPPDYDQFIQCWECGNIYPIYQSYPETEIKDSLETVNNPFESNESVFLSTDNRATQRRKRERRDHYRKGVHRYKSKRLEQYNEQEDPDIQREIDIHGSDNVRIIQDTDT